MNYSTRAIIMADGEGKRWKKETLPSNSLFSVKNAKKLLAYGPYEGAKKAIRKLKKEKDKRAVGGLKQLLKVDGETLLERQVRLLRENGVTDVYVASSREECEVSGAQRFEPLDNIYEIDRFRSSRSLWNREGYTLYVYGDVFYTDLAMKCLCSAECSDWVWFGRASGGAAPGQDEAELFGFKFCSESSELVERKIEFVRDEFIRGAIEKCIGWELFRALEDVPLDAPLSGVKKDRLFPVDDLTNDFDTLSEYEKWMHFYSKAEPSEVFRDLKSILEKNSVEAKGVIHVGCHVCRELEYYDVFENILLIDANPFYYSYLTFLGRWDSRISVANCGIGNGYSKEKFFVTKYDQASSLLAPLEHSLDFATEVSVMPLSDFQGDEYNVLVVDVQGSEKSVLESSDLSLVDVIIVELNHVARYEGGARAEEVQEMLNEKGFVEESVYQHEEHGMADHLFLRRVSGRGR